MLGKYGWEWAVDKLRRELNYTADVKTNEEETFIVVTIESPQGDVVLTSTLTEAHVVQFVIDAFRTAMWEVLQ